MTWEIVVGLITLVGAVITIATIISNNTRAMTEVKCSIDSLNDTVKSQALDLKSVQMTVQDHETRITVLEKGNGK